MASHFLSLILKQLDLAILFFNLLVGRGSYKYYFICTNTKIKAAQGAYKIHRSIPVQRNLKYSLK